MTTTETNHAEQQAKAQLEIIIELVSKLDRKKSAHLYARDISRERCIELLTDVGIDTDDDETAEELREAVAENIADETIDPEDFEFDEDAARQAIEEDALSVEVRSDWYTPGDSENSKPTEYNILLCAGGPAVRIIGEFDDYSQPSSARLEYQDWFTPWTEYITTGDDHDALLTYAQCFYFGE